MVSMRATMVSCHSQRRCELGAPIAAIADEGREEREQPADGSQQRWGAVAILDAGRMHLDGQEAERVNQHMALRLA
jgi:hypothetical protein